MQPTTGRERSLANLQPIRDKETARKLGAKGIQAKRAKKAEQERLQAEADNRSREKLAKLAYEALFNALQDTDVPVQARLTAAREALDRLEGRPTQRVETSQASPLAELAELSQAELEARLAGLQERRLRLVKSESAADSTPNAQEGSG